jgi:CRISPR/Cas system-associated endonuclease Cas1
MSDAKMPEPVAYMDKETKYLMNYTTHPERHHKLVTMEQAEEYARHRVNEALQDAIRECLNRHDLEQNEEGKKAIQRCVHAIFAFKEEPT